MAEDSFSPGHTMVGNVTPYIRLSITKREYFAGCALQGILATIDRDRSTQAMLDRAVEDAAYVSHQMMEATDLPK